MIWILISLIALLAWANGANDNCKGVATLVGYGATSVRRALIWAAVTTGLGAVVSFWAAAGLIGAFSGGGIFGAGPGLDTSFFVSVLAGALAWVLIATLLGMPVSTTHAITGGLCGVALVTFGAAGVQWTVLGQRFAVPLLLGPLLALAMVYAVAFPLGWLMGRFAGRCACVIEEQTEVVTTTGHVARVAGRVRIVIDNEAQCIGEAGVRTSAVASGSHWTAAGLVGFARGWNDAPKIAALAIGSLAASGVGYPAASAFAIVILAMTVGGLTAGRRVLTTLSHKVTPMPLPESITASSVTALLVGMASWNGLPVSTTHVSTGAIMGIGLKNDASKVRWSTVGQIACAWLITLPFAAAISALTAWAMQRANG